MDEAEFWQTVDDVRSAAGGDPYAMADLLAGLFAAADDAALLGFQRCLVAASRRLHTGRHWDAADLLYGFTSSDVFTDFRSWVIAQGRQTYERVVEDPDNLADIEDLAGGCEADGEIFGAAVSSIWYDRHGYGDASFPMVEDVGELDGEQLGDAAAVRAALPRLSARVPADAYGGPSREFPG